ncbi:MAG TPA: hypothetical protein DCQ31_16470, partial [Bacteroidales bacterium]|nr:hypothetical protein [Bacteroidales bacterium]
FLAIILYRSYRYKHNTNLVLIKQKVEIEELNDEYVAVNEELKQSNEQLYETKLLVEERENLIVQITDNVPVLIALLDSDLKYRFVNKRYAETFSFEKNAIIGKTVKEVMSKESCRISAEHIHKPLVGETVTFENTLHCKKDSEQIVNTTYLPYFQNETIDGVLVCSSDITERKKAEKALRESEAERQRLQALEMERINTELEANQKAMTVATLKLLQNSERDSQTIDQLAEIERNTNPEGKKQINTVISNYKRASFNSNWDEFELLFEKTHRTFYENLNTKFPNLTGNERKICAFLKLNMSSKDIAQITFQSED